MPQKTHSRIKKHADLSDGVAERSKEVERKTLAECGTHVGTVEADSNDDWDDDGLTWIEDGVVGGGSSLRRIVAEVVSMFPEDTEYDMTANALWSCLSFQNRTVVFLIDTAGLEGPTEGLLHRKIAFSRSIDEMPREHVMATIGHEIALFQWGHSYPDDGEGDLAEARAWAVLNGFPRPQQAQGQETVDHESPGTRIHSHPLSDGITRSREFERKTLAEFAINVGTRCSHDCCYCSSGSMLRMHSSFRETGEDPFEFGYAIIDPDTPDKVARDAKRKRKRGLAMLCTTVDAWCPAAQRYDLGRGCLQAILAEPDWNVRILTKNAAVVRDFDLIRQHRDRVLVGLSLTATPDKADLTTVVEPNASSILERIAALARADLLGLRTYAMLCPLLPGVADRPEQIDNLVRIAEGIGAEEVFAEPVNPRGSGLKNTEEALRAAGHEEAADAVHAIRSKANWSRYVVELVANVQRAMRSRGMIDKLRFLLYPSRLAQQDRAAIERDDEGVIWLGKNEKEA